MLETRETLALVAALGAFTAAAIGTAAVTMAHAQGSGISGPRAGPTARSGDVRQRPPAPVPRSQLGSFPLPAVRGEAARAVDPGPLAVQVRAAAAALNDIGASVRLRVVRPGARAQIVVRRSGHLPSSVLGVTTLACRTPCRPFDATIEIDARRMPSDALLHVVAHELGHALGLAHDVGPTHESCGLMAAVLEPECYRAPLVAAADRRALLALWGPAPHGRRADGPPSQSDDH